MEKLEGMNLMKRQKSPVTPTSEAVADGVLLPFHSWGNKELASLLISFQYEDTSCEGLGPLFH